MSDEYISRDEARELAHKVCNFVEYDDVELDMMVDAILAADVKPVAHASWVQDDEIIGGDIWRKWRCDECGYVRKKGWAYEPEGRKPTARFCENCGADMRSNHG